MPRSLIENGDEESQPKTATTRRTRAAPVPESPVRRSMRIRHISGKQSSVGDSPDTPNRLARTRRSIRASSETKSPPPVVRITRRTRATSIEPEQTIERISKAAAPSTTTRRRRTQISALPTEPIVPEETSESSTPSPQKSSPLKNFSFNVEMEVDKSPEAEEAQAKDIGKSKSPRSKTELLKLDDTYVDNEVIEEFTLHDSDSSKSDNLKPRLSLTVDNSDGGEGERESDSSENIFETSKETNTVNENAKGSSKPVMQIKKLSLTLERVSPQRKSDVKISPQKKDLLEKVADLEIGEEDEEMGSLEEKKNCDESAKSFSSPENNGDTVAKLKVESLSNINSKRDAAEEKCLDADDEGEETETRSAGKSSPRVAVEKNQLSKIERNNRISDSDSSLTIDRLFHDISAEEWNKRRKSQELTKNRKSIDSNKPKSPATKAAIDSDEDTDIAENKSRKENGEVKNDEGNDSTDSTDTIVLVQKGRSEPSKGQRKSTEKTIVEEENQESSDEEPAKLPGNNKSPNKSEKVRESKSAEPEVRKPEIASHDEEEEEEEEEERMEVDDVELNEAETTSTSLTDKNCGLSKEFEKVEEEVEEAEASPKKTPKSEKKKSPIKLGKNSAKKSRDVYEFNDSLDSREEETEALTTPKESSLDGRTPKKPFIRNYSMVAVADSESQSDKTFSEEESDDSKQALPGFLFNVDSSGEDNDEKETPEKSSNTIDSDIAREMNLAGDDDVAYSDDDVQGDECHASESEHSDEDDGGSDLNDFVVADDAVESSEVSDNEEEEEKEEEEEERENTPRKSKFKRIIDKSSSEEEEAIKDLPEENKEKEEEEKEEEEEEEGEEGEEEEKKPKRKISLGIELAEKPKRRMSLGAETVKSASASKKLNKSVELSRSSSVKKVKKFALEDMKIAIELGESGRKFKKLSGLVSAALDTTVDLCTPEQEAEEEEEEEAEESEEGEIASSSSPDVLNASSDRKSLDKLRKNLADDLISFTPDKIATQIGNGNRASTTPKTKTPVRLSEGSKENTPKSLKKNKRDSMQIIAECGSITPKSSSLNKTMLTPNSETPVTKFLKKERLNESLPLIELNKRSTKRLSEGSTMSKMLEVQLEDDVSEAEDPQEETDESSNEGEEDEASEDAQENGKVLNGMTEESEEHDEPEISEEGNEDDEGEENGAEIESEEGVEDDGEEEEESDNEEVFDVKSKRNKDSAEKIKVLKRQEKSLTRRSKAEIEEKEEEEEEEEEAKSEDEETIDVKRKRNKDSPKEVRELERQQKSSKRRNKSETKKDETSAQVKISVTPKNRGRDKSDDEADEEGKIPLSKKRSLSNSANVTTLERKKRARVESSVVTPQSMKEMQKPKIIACEAESDSDEAPESVGFSEARGAALQAMKDVASSLKAAKDAKKKKRIEHQARIKEEREAKLASTVSSQSKVKTSLKRLPDDFLFSLSDISQRPNKKLKMTKKVEQILPSTSSFEPGKPTKSSIITEKQTSPLSSAGSTTLFSVTNLKKVNKKQAKKAATVASFRDRMLARNPRQPVSAFLVYQAKQMAAGFHSSNRK